MRFLNIKTDYAFKKVFGSENSKNILMRRNIFKTFFNNKDKGEIKNAYLSPNE